MAEEDIAQFWYTQLGSQTRTSLVNNINFVRYARSGDDWTINELLAFNIEVQHTTAATFFDTADLPEVSVPETILNNLQELDGPLSKTECKFFQYMQDAEREGSEQPTTSDFTVFLLNLMDYDRDTWLLRTKRVMPFYMAGQHVDAKVDVVLMDRNRHLLLVQQEQRTASGDDPEPRLIAGCIAAFRMNNYRRSQSGLPPVEKQVMPGIIMVGTTPIFYHITVTAALIDALVTSTYPVEPTIVLKCIPPVPNPTKYAIKGIRPLENRRVVFQCLEAFKMAIVTSSS